MSSIHWQPERSTTSAPEGQGTPVATEPQATRLTPLSQSLIEQFMQQVSPTQGQLPTALAQSLQTLLRQMPLLSLQLGVEVTTVNPSQATEDRNPAMQWLNRLVPILLRMEPSLRLPVPIPLAPSEPAPTTLSTGQPALPPTSPHDSTLLQLLQQQPPLGRALLHWALQLLSQHPKLMAQFSTQEQQQFRQQTKVTLPPTANTQAANKSDSFTLSPRQLPVLLRATLPLLQNQTTASAKAAISQPQGDPKTNSPPASASSAKAPMAQTQPQDASRTRPTQRPHRRPKHQQTRSRPPCSSNHHYWGVCCCRVSRHCYRPHTGYHQLEQQHRRYHRLRRQHRRHHRLRQALFPKAN